MQFLKANDQRILKGQLLKTDTGRVIRAESSTAEALIGVALDSYASDTSGELVSVIVPTEQWMEWEIDIDSDGGLVASDVLTFRDLASDSNGIGNSIARGNSVDGVIFITKRISATKALGVIAKSAVNSPNVSLFVTT